MSINTTHPIKSAEFIEFNVGGRPIFFSESSLNKPHMKGSLPGLKVNGNWVRDKVGCIDVDPDFFNKWIAPYIRHSLLPTASDLSSYSERLRLVRAAKSLALVKLADHIEATMLNAKFFVWIKFTGTFSFNKSRSPIRISVHATQKIKKVFKALKEKNLYENCYRKGKNYWHRKEVGPASLLWNELIFSFESQHLSSNQTFGFYGIKPGSEIEMTE